MSTRIVKGLAFALILYVGLTSIIGFREFGESLGQISLGIWLLGPSICLFSHIVLEGRWQFYLKRLGWFKMAIVTPALLIISLNLFERVITT